MTSRLTVFISSTSRDLSEYRERVAQVALRLGLYPIIMEAFNATDQNALQLCYNKTQEANLFVGIYAYRYGYSPGDDLSYRAIDGQLHPGDGVTSITHLEYEWAKARGIPMLLFVVSDTDAQGQPLVWDARYIEGEPGKTRLVQFKDHVLKQHVVGFFYSPDHLALQVATSLADILRKSFGRGPVTTQPLAPADLSGQRLKSYDIQGTLGTGGFAVVYRAYQSVLNREVALKIIKPEYANEPDFIRRFEIEAQLVSRLEHPHIIPLFDYWREPSGAYLVMRYVRGGSLSTALLDGQWALEPTLLLLEQISSALWLAHRAGVIHRDIKPDNILLDDDHNAYLTDFGIAQLIGQPHNDSEKSVSGTLDYIAPEQLMGAVPMPQTDIYALGLVIYELLAGEHAYPDMTPAERVHKHLYDPIPKISLKRPELPASLDEVLAQATAKDPQARYRDVRSFVIAFQQACDASVDLSSTLDEELSNPYKGLRSFEQSDADDFYGRAALVSQLVTRLSESGEYQRFLAVVGPSGSGKSSVVKAGLIPALLRGDVSGSENWFIAEMVPGTSPLAALETALISVALRPPTDLPDMLRDNVKGLQWAVDRVLGDSDADLLLLIDQFEEVFTLTTDETERAHFLASLVAATTGTTSRLRVIVTLRADFMDKPLYYNLFAAMMTERVEYVLPLTAAELGDVIIQPAEQHGLHVENQLVAAMIADVREEPGALPLLQYALTELFERREDRRLTLRAYQATGGVLGAIARRADELYGELTPLEQASAQQIFLRLVTPGEGTEDTRRRITRFELDAVLGQDAAVGVVLDRFGRARLLTFDRTSTSREPTVEIAHEALIRTWGQLRQWLDDARDDVRLQRGLANSLAEWDASGRSTDYLLSGSRLAQYVEWAQTTRIALSTHERAFVAASDAEATARREQDEARKAYEVTLQDQAANRLRIITGLLSFSVLAVFLVVVALSAQRDALQSSAQAADALVARDTQAAESNLARDQLADAVGQLQSQNEQSLNVGGGLADYVADDEARLVLESFSWALNAQASLARGDLVQAAAQAIAANSILPQPPPPAQRILSHLLYQPLTQRVFRADTNFVVISPDGQWGLDRRIYTPDITNDRLTKLTLIHLQSGQTPQSYAPFDATPTPPQTTNNLATVLVGAFSPDSRLLLTWDTERRLILWHVETGTVLRRLPFQPTDITALAISNDADLTLVGGNDGSLTWWDAMQGQILLRTEATNQAMLLLRSEAVSYGPSLLHIAPNNLWTVSYHQVDGILKIWDNASFAVSQSVRFDVGPDAIAIRPDSQQFALLYRGTLEIYSEDGTRLHNYSLSWPGETPSGGTNLTYLGNETLLVILDDGAMLFVNAETGDLVRSLLSPLTDEVADAVFIAKGTSDAHLVLEGSNWYETVQFNDITTAWWRSTESQSAISHLLVVSDDSFLTRANDGAVRLWDSTTGDLRRTLAPDIVDFVGFKLSVDRTHLYIHSKTSFSVWDLATGQQVSQIDDERLANSWVAVSQDGQQMISGVVCTYPNTNDYYVTRILTWDLTTGKMEREAIRDRTECDAVAVIKETALSLDNQWVALPHIWGVELIDLISGETRVFQASTAIPPGRCDNRRICRRIPQALTIAFNPTGDQIIWTDGLHETTWDVKTGVQLSDHSYYAGRLPEEAVELEVDMQDGVLRFLDIRTGDTLREIPSYRGITVFAFTPMGDALLIGTENGHIGRITLRTLPEMLDWARKQYRLDDNSAPVLETPTPASDVTENTPIPTSTLTLTPTPAATSLGRFITATPSPP